MIIRAKNVKDFIPFAEKLGWKGIGIIIDYKDLEGLKKIKKTIKNLDIAFGIEIEPKRASSLKRHVLKIRKEVELVLVSGGDLDINRKALETPEVDILTHPWGSLNNLRSDPGINHISARLAKENNVAISFNFGDLIHSYQRKRTALFQNYLGAAKLIKKYKSPFVITSGALSPWDMRSPSDLFSFGKILGLGDREIKASMLGRTVKENRKRLGKKWIMPGVEIVSK